MTKNAELVVLASEDGQAIGTTPKATVHTTDTPLHFAFSCYVIRSDGKLLLSRRALNKKTWPGVWTNSMCGHPGDGEAILDAVRRRGTQELGLPADALHDLRVVLPDFRYRAVDSSGIVEYEICPVHVAELGDGVEVSPHPAEVDSWEWIEPSALFDAIDSAPFTFSPWMVEQLQDQRLRKALINPANA